MTPSSPGSAGNTSGNTVRNPDQLPSPYIPMTDEERAHMHAELDTTVDEISRVERHTEWLVEPFVKQMAGVGIDSAEAIKILRQQGGTQGNVISADPRNPTPGIGSLTELENRRTELVGSLYQQFARSDGATFLDRLGAATNHSHDKAVVTQRERSQAHPQLTQAQATFRKATIAHHDASRTWTEQPTPPKVNRFVEAPEGAPTRLISHGAFNTYDVFTHVEKLRREAANGLYEAEQRESKASREARIAANTRLSLFDIHQNIEAEHEQRIANILFFQEWVRGELDNWPLDAAATNSSSDIRLDLQILNSELSKLPERDTLKEYLIPAAQRLRYRLEQREILRGNIQEAQYTADGGIALNSSGEIVYRNGEAHPPTGRVHSLILPDVRDYQVDPTTTSQQAWEDLDRAWAGVPVNGSREVATQTAIFLKEADHEIATRESIMEDRSTTITRLEHTIKQEQDGYDKLLRQGHAATDPVCVSVDKKINDLLQQHTDTLNDIRNIRSQLNVVLYRRHLVAAGTSATKDTVRSSEPLIDPGGVVQPSGEVECEITMNGIHARWTIFPDGRSMHYDAATGQAQWYHPNGQPV